MNLDKIHNYRQILLDILKEKSVELEIDDKIFIGYGGSVGIAIYPIEYDKTQILEHLQNKYNEIHYFGDKYQIDGNDYNIINNKNVIGHCSVHWTQNPRSGIDNINDTIKILNELKN